MSQVACLIEGQVELVKWWWREAEERQLHKDVEVAAELEAAQLAEEETRQKEEERQQMLEEIQQEYEEEVKQKEVEKAKGKKRKAEEAEESDKRSVKRKRR